MLFEALTNFSYMPQIIVEPTQVVTGPNTPKVPVTTLQPTPNVNSTTPPEKPRKSSVSEDVLTPRVLAEVNVILFLIKYNLLNLTLFFFNLHFFIPSIIIIDSDKLTNREKKIETMIETIDWNPPTTTDKRDLTF